MKRQAMLHRVGHCSGCGEQSIIRLEYCHPMDAEHTGLCRMCATAVLGLADRQAGRLAKMPGQTPPELN